MCVCVCVCVCVRVCVCVCTGWFWNRRGDMSIPSMVTLEGSLAPATRLKVGKRSIVAASWPRERRSIHLPLLTPHPSPLTPHPSPLTPHPSSLTPHPSPLTPHLLCPSWLYPPWPPRNCRHPLPSLPRRALPTPQETCIASPDLSDQGGTEGGKEEGLC